MKTTEIDQALIESDVRLAMDYPLIQRHQNWVEKFNIYFGVPIFGNKEKDAELEGYGCSIFKAQRVKLNNSDGNTTSLTNVMVLKDHGWIIPEVKNWTSWGSGRQFDQVLNIYHKIATFMGWRPIDLIFACNDETQYGDILKGEVAYGGETVPYIYPAGDVIYDLVSDRQIENVTRKGEGLRSLNLDANWRGLERWLKFRQERGILGRTPLWAKYPQYDFKDLVALANEE